MSIFDSEVKLFCGPALVIDLIRLFDGDLILLDVDLRLLDFSFNACEDGSIILDDGNQQ